jgi:hypothetical protein
MIGRLTIDCNTAFSQLSQEQKDRFQAEVMCIAHLINSCSEQSKKEMIKNGFKKLAEILSELCPNLAVFDIRLISAIMLGCLDDLVFKRLEVIKVYFPDLISIIPSMAEAHLKKNMLDSEHRYQKEIDIIEQELRKNDWKDTKTGDAERKLTLLHGLQRARATATSVHALNSSGERVSKYGNSSKYQKLINV